MFRATARGNIWFALLILSIFALFMIPSFKQQTLFAQKQSGFSVYENRIYNFRMEYPSDWKKQSSPISFAYIVTFDVPTDKQNNILNPLIEKLFGAKSSSPEEASEVSVIYQNLSFQDSHDVKTYANKILDQLRALPGNTMFDELGDATLSGIPAYKIVFTQPDPLNVSGKFKQMSIYTIVDNRAFELTYSAKSEIYDKYLPLIQHTIESFKFTK